MEKRNSEGKGGSASKKIRHRVMNWQFYVLPWILAHMHYTHKTMKALGSAPNGFGDF